MKNRFFLMLILVLSILVLTACKENTFKLYKLTLPTEVSADVNDLNNISENTVVTLTVNVPANKQVAEFKINDNSVTLTNNTYVLTITEDVIVTIIFTDIEQELNYFKLTLPDGVSANIGDLDNILQGSEVILTITVPENKLIDSFKINNESKTVVNNQFTFNITENTVVEITFADIEPEATYFKLTLDPGITSDVTNLNQVEENTLVTVTITVPENKYVDSFKVNGEEKELSNNSYSFTITKNTNITVTFEDLTQGVTYYSLILPTEVNSNFTNLTQIEENSEVILTLNLVGNLEVDKFLVNNEEVTLVNNKYTFNITKNTTVEVVYLTAWEEVEQTDIEALVNSLDLTIYRPGTFKLVNRQIVDEHKVDIVSWFLLDENFDLIQGYEINSSYSQDILENVFINYLDGSYNYLIIDNHNSEGERYHSSSHVSYMDTSMQGLEIFGAFFGEDPIMPKGFNSLNDLINNIFNNGKESLLNGELFDSAKYFEYDNLIKIEIIDEHNFLVDLFIEFRDFFEGDDELVIILEDNKVKQVTFKRGDDAFIEFIYEEFDFEIDERIAAINTSEVEYNTYNYHLGEDEVVTVSLDLEFVDEFVNVSLFEIYNLLKPYKPTKRVTALYLDEDFTTLLEVEDFLTDNLDIYVKWEEILSPEQVITSLIIDDVLFLKTLDDQQIYYEDEQYIYYRRYNYNLTIIDKVNEKHYEVILMGPGSFTSHVTNFFSDQEFLLTALKNYKNEEFILIKGLNINIFDDLLLIGNWLNIGDYNFAVIEPEMFVKNDDLFDTSEIDQYIAGAVEDEIAYAAALGHHGYIDIDNIENEMSFEIIYHSGKTSHVSVSEALDLGVTYYIDGSVLNVYYEGQAHIFTDYFFYDSSKGQAIIVDGFKLFYLPELTDLPEPNLNENYQFIHFVVAETGQIITTFEDLLNVEFTKKYLIIYTNSEKIDGVEVLNNLKDVTSFTLSPLNYETTYNALDRTYQMLYFDDEFIFKIDEHYYYFSTNDSYLQIPIENFDLENLVFLSW